MFQRVNPLSISASFSQFTEIDVTEVQTMKMWNRVQLLTILYKN